MNLRAPASASSRDARGIGAHVGDETHAAEISQLESFVQLLCDDHGLCRGEIELARRFLLERAGDERRIGLSRFFHTLHIDDGERLVVEPFHDGFGRGGIRQDSQAFSTVCTFAPSTDRSFAQNSMPLYSMLGMNRPVFPLDERLDFVLAFADEPQRHRLHAAGGKAAKHGAPEDWRYLVPHDPVEDPPRLLRVHLVHVDFTRLVDCSQHRAFGDFVELHALDVRIRLCNFWATCQAMASPSRSGSGARYTMSALRRFVLERP